MTPLEKAIKEISKIINQYIPKLEEKYLNIEFSSNEQGVLLTCYMEHNEKITLRAIEDYDRKTFFPPKNSKEYQKQGGHKALINNIKRINPNAWKIEVRQTIKNQIMEIGFSGNEANWNPDSFEREFVKTIINRI